MIVASWNIEKNGQSSSLDKQSKVSHFIDQVCGNYDGKGSYADVIFLCEVHSGREEDYKVFLNGTYGNYEFTVFPGGYSNSYVVGVRKGVRFQFSYDHLKGLNRKLILLHAEGHPALVLAHFKSGGNGTTQAQLEAAAQSLQEMYPDGRWAIAGDINWDFQRRGELNMPQGANGYVCWDQTHVKGGNLDWCIAGYGVRVGAAFPQMSGLNEVLDMQGPDHRPVIFSVC